MKNFFSNVKKSGPLKSRIQLSIDKNMVDSEGMLTLWNLMDAMNSVKKDRFQSLLLNNRYEESVTKIDLKLYRNAALGEELLIESNLAPHGKRQVDLKVYISKRIKGEPARRVCKAVYTLTIKPK